MRPLHVCYHTYASEQQEQQGESDRPLESTSTATGTRAIARPRLFAWSRYHLGLTAIILLAAFLYFFRLDEGGYGNEYYAATAKSMLTSWHNFFFASFDPAGFVTVDKPPLGFWLQAGSAGLLGLSRFSLMLPQALAGILSVALLYHLVNRVFGPVVGLLAALAMVLTPIMVADSRVNDLDCMLLLALLLAAWAGTLAVEKSSLPLLLLCFGFVGLGFNIKMSQAFGVLPALCLLYLLGSPHGWWRRVMHLSLAAVVLLIVSLSWAIVVDLTPPDQRPYVGSSQNNTVMNLITQHNGLERLTQNAGPLGPGPGGGALAPPPGGPAPMITLPPGAQPLQVRPGPGGTGGGFEGGSPGPLRLFNRELGGQISWLLPLALLGIAVAAWQTRFRLPLGRRHEALVLWGGWLVGFGAVFSFASGLFHPYYVTMLAPAIAALFGAGLVAMWKDYHRHLWRGWLLPFALVVTAALQIPIVAYYPGWTTWLIPALGITSLCAATVLVVERWSGPFRRSALASGAIGVGVLALLIGPAAWSAATALARTGGVLPYAGPQLGNQPGNLPPPQGNLSATSKLVEYLQANRRGERFLAAVPGTQTAAPISLQTGQPVMAMGGFSGGDPILTADKVSKLVAEGMVRFFLITGAGPGSGSETSRWVQGNCKAVPSEEWQTGGPVDNLITGPPGSANMQLYDCAK